MMKLFWFVIHFKIGGATVEIIMGGTSGVIAVLFKSTCNLPNTFHPYLTKQQGQKWSFSESSVMMTVSLLMPSKSQAGSNYL